MVLDPSDGVEYLKSFTLETDKEIRTEQAAGVIINNTGTVITFIDQFHSIPVITVTPQGAASLIATIESPSTTQFEAHIFDSGGSEVGGPLDWKARGA